jgi:hypothetical protein
MKLEGANAMKSNIVTVVVIGVMSLGLLFLVGGSACALQVVLTAEDIAVVENPSDTSEERVIIRYDMPEILAESEIFYAQLTAKVNVTVGTEGIAEVELMPITTQWQPGSVTWSSPWSEPGGDVDTSMRRSFLVREGTRQVRIDVTDLVIEWVSCERANTGLIVKPSTTSEGRFTLPINRGGLGALYETPVIKVWYLPKIQ